MKKNRLKLSMAAFAALTALSLSGCGQKNSEITEAAVSQEETTEQAVSENKQIRVVTTIFPEYDWVKQIAGDEASNMDLKLLLDNGVDLHSYQPTAEDIMKISDCDLFVYVGGESDTWVDGALKEAVNKDMKVINLLDVLKDTIKTEEAMPGMQNEEGHNHGYSHFADSDVQDRSLEDWTGDWQSVYPYLENGDLNEVMKKKAESGEKTEEEYKQYYETGYKTDVEKIVIDGANGTMEFTKDGNAAKGTYEYRGYQIYDYKSGSRGVRYFFEKTSGSDEAPRYVQFSDHGIAPGKAEHFHIYAGNESFDALSTDIINSLQGVDIGAAASSGVFGGIGSITSPIMVIFIIIMMGYAVIKCFFSNLKRGGVLLIQIAVGSLYMFSVPRGYMDGFVQWCKQIIGLCLTTFLQATILTAGLLVLKDHALLGLGLMLSAGEVPRICGAFGLDTSTRANIMSAVYAAQSAVNTTRTVVQAVGAAK